MKIGIMTFHWATNYGAILQAYCLQEYLREQGHEVEIINYKPKRYDTTWWNYLKHPSNWKRIKKFPIMAKKEELLDEFRKEYLRLSKRFSTNWMLQNASVDYDVLLSGSDQILNSSFTMAGENKPTSVYYLDFGRKDALRLGYAVSFGCTQYEDRAVPIASKWIQNFEAIGVRENSGLDILTQLSYKKARQVVPDPTILYGKKLFESIGVSIADEKEDYTCVYMLRREIKIDGNVHYIDETKQPLSMKQWLTTISQSRFLITNSYHGTIMAILSHVPFAVILEGGKTEGMNDRFKSLLQRLSLSERMVTSVDMLNSIKNQSINWYDIDKKIQEIKGIGSEFLNLVDAKIKTQHSL